MYSGTKIKAHNFLPEEQAYMVAIENKCRIDNDLTSSIQDTDKVDRLCKEARTKYKKAKKNSMWRL